jgi:hypothetical protein
MGRHTGNITVTKSLHDALDAFLKDHRSVAEKDPEWQKARAGTEEELSESGCGCEDCRIAGELLANIY